MLEILVVFGSAFRTGKRFRFKTKKEMNAFLAGLDYQCGWDGAQVCFTREEFLGIVGRCKEGGCELIDETRKPIEIGGNK